MQGQVRGLPFEPIDVSTVSGGGAGGAAESRAPSPDRGDEWGRPQEEVSDNVVGDVGRPWGESLLEYIIFSVAKICTLRNEIFTL